MFTDKVLWMCRECKTHNDGTMLCIKCNSVRPSLPKIVQTSVNEVKGLYRYWKTPLSVQRIAEVISDGLKGKKFNIQTEKKPKGVNKFEAARRNEMTRKLTAAGVMKNGQPTIV